MEKKNFKPLMDEEEAVRVLSKKKQEYLNSIIEDFDKGILHILNYEGVSRFKSVRRAIKRGKVDLFTGTVYPKRPFNNRKPTPGRRFNESRKTIYGEIGKD